MGIAGCSSAPAYPPIEIDLSAMGIRPITAGTPPATVTAAGAIAAVERERGPIEVVRLGRRWTAGPQTVWVVVYRPKGAGPDADWLALTVDDQNSSIVAGFDEASLRAFGIAVPDW